MRPITPSNEYWKRGNGTKSRHFPLPPPPQILHWEFQFPWHVGQYYLVTQKLFVSLSYFWVCFSNCTILVFGFTADSRRVEPQTFLIFPRCTAAREASPGMYDIPLPAVNRWCSDVYDMCVQCKCMYILLQKLNYIPISRSPVLRVGSAITAALMSASTLAGILLGAWDGRLWRFISVISPVRRIADNHLQWSFVSTGQMYTNSTPHSLESTKGVSWCGQRQVSQVDTM